MLVLSRFLNESITIGENIVITVVGIRGDKVRLGIEAPKEVIIHRPEVIEKILQENVRRVGQGLPPIDPFKRADAEEITRQKQERKAS